MSETPTTQEKSAMEQQLSDTGLPYSKGGRRVFKTPSDERDENPENTEAMDHWLPRWAKNSARNFPVISRSWGVNALSECAKDLPVFVIGIGPSLDKSIGALKMIRNRGIIIATDAAVRPLLAQGIRPDMAITLDAKKEQSSVWETADTSRIPLVCGSCSHPDTIRNWHGPILFFNMYLYKNDFVRSLLPCIYPHLGSIDSVGTVGSMGVLLANGMGADTVITVGMDLCYKPNVNPMEAIPAEGVIWKYRCADYMQEPQANGEPIWKRTENILYDNDRRLKGMWEEEINGTKYKVDDALKFYRKGLVKYVGEHHISMIDCSDGVLKEFLPSMELDRAIANHCKSEMSALRTTLPYLWKIVPDGKQLAFDAHEYSGAH